MFWDQWEETGMETVVRGVHGYTKDIIIINEADGNWLGELDG